MLLAGMNDSYEKSQLAVQNQHRFYITKSLRSSPLKDSRKQNETHLLYLIDNVLNVPVSPKWQNTRSPLSTAMLLDQFFTNSSCIILNRRAFRCL